MSFDADAQGLGARALGLAASARDPFINARRGASSVKRVALGLDSLTNGSGATPPATYGIPLSAALRAKYGDAGFGPIIWSDGRAGGIGHSANFFAVDNLNPGGSSTAWTDAIKLGSINGCGYYRSAGTGATDAEYVLYNPNTADAFNRGAAETVTWAMIHFTLRSSGSFFKVRQTNEPAGSAVTIDSTNFLIGSPQVCVYQYNQSYNQSLQVFQVNGDVTIDAVETYTGNPGVTVTNLGLGGISAYEWSLLDDTAQRLWWQQLAFDVVLLNAGMNDRSFVGPTAFGASIEKIVSRIQACPKTKILLIRPNDSSDWASTNLQYYDSVLQNIASRRGCGYADNRDVLGSYTAANAAGYMQGDGVHPTATANQLLGAYHAAKLSL